MKNLKTNLLVFFKNFRLFFKRLECFLFGHDWGFFSTFTKKSHNLNTGQRFCRNCGKMQLKTKQSKKEKFLHKFANN